MKRAFKSLAAVALLVLISPNCSARMPQVTAFKNINLVPMMEETIVKNQTVLVKGEMIIESLLLWIHHYLTLRFFQICQRLHLWLV